MFSLKVPATLYHTKITSASAANVTTGAATVVALSRILDFQRYFYKRLLLISLYCCCYTLIVAAPQAVAFPMDSLMMLQPQVNTSTGTAVKHLQAYLSSEATTMEETVLTPGQQVINAVPHNERGDFIMYELAIALQQVKETDVMLRKYLKNLEDIQKHYGKKLTNLKTVPIYGNFPADLLQWFESEFNLTHLSVYNQLRSRSPIMCNAEGVCYNSDKIGCLCCPF